MDILHKQFSLYGTGYFTLSVVQGRSYHEHEIMLFG